MSRATFVIFLILGALFGQIICNYHKVSTNTCRLDQLSDGKWKSYDMILDNCLVRRFLDSRSTDDEPAIDFYPLILSLQDLIDKQIKNIKLQIDSLNNRRQSAVGMKQQLTIQATKRTLKQNQLDLIKLQEEAELRVTLMETDIRDYMDKCLRQRPNVNAISNRSHQWTSDSCFRQGSDHLSRARGLCNWLKSQGSLLLASVANFNLESRLDRQFLMTELEN